MLAYVLAIPYALLDILIAAFDMIIGRKRRRYSHRGLVMAPADVTWAMVSEPSVTYSNIQLKVVTRPIETEPGIFTADVVLRDKVIATPVFERRIDHANRSLADRQLRDRCSNPAHYGDDDIVMTHVEAVGEAKSRITFERELTHRVSATRITAPVGLRQAVWLVQTASSERAGTMPKPSLARSILAQGFWAIAAAASFVWLTDVETAVILVALIVLHELGHALAMWGFGLGVRRIALIPFFGGMAIPKRRYESQWQLGLVALAGPAFSLVPTGLLTWAALNDDAPALAYAANLFAVINLVNLAPLGMLDGGLILRSLLTSVSSNLARLAEVVSVGILLAIAVYLRSPIIAVVAALGIIQVVHAASFKFDALMRRLRPGEAAVLIMAYLVIAAALAFCAWTTWGLVFEPA